MKRIIILIVFALSVKISTAQDLGAYTDYMGHFFIFDHGVSTKVEDLPVQSFDIGAECILYVNSQGHLCLYQNKITTKLESGGVTKYFATDYLAAYSVFQKLKVVENGTVVILSLNSPIFNVQDSLIAFYDGDLASLRVYYKGKVSDIESGLLGRPVSKYSSGDNIVAYISSISHDFKIWYCGSNTTILRNIDGLSFKAGTDIVAYVNSLDNTFHAFYKGNDYQLEDFPPKSYKMGFGFVAYVSYSGEFKVFYNGEANTLSSYAPDSYSTKDKLLAFNEDNYFKVFWNGKVYELESYIPGSYKMGWNSLAYLDNTNRIWLFSEGEKKYLLNDFVTSFDDYRDLVVMGVKINRTIIYYKGKFYDGATL
jgi:hypothetical protein